MNLPMKNTKTKVNYRALYENLSKRISALNRYADVFKVDLRDKEAIRILEDYMACPDNIYRKLKNIAWGRK